MPQTLVLEDVLDAAIDTALRNVWTAMPGQVESYDAETQTADVQVTVQNGTVMESGDRRAETVAVLTSVPVVHAGGGGFRAVFPVRRGDTVLLVFASRSIARWLTRGGVTDPKTDHHHDVSDAVAITGLRDLRHALTSVPSDHASVGFEGGASIEYYQNEVRVGGNIGAETTLKSPQFLSALGILLTAIATQVGVSGTPASATAAGEAITAAIETFNTAESGFTTIAAKVV